MMKQLPRTTTAIEIVIDGLKVPAYPGESVLSVLMAIGKKNISRNDHGLLQGANCGMGICYCCLVEIDGVAKQRACQTLVHEGMSVKTRSNHFQNLKPVTPIG